MKANKFLMIAALATASAATPAFAQHVTPAATAFNLDGIATLAKPVGNTPLTCNLSFSSATGTTTGPNVGGGKASGGTLGTGTNTGTGCTTLVVSSSGFTIDSAVSGSTTEWNGTLARVKVTESASSTVLCDGTNIPFTIDDTGYVHMDTNVAAPPGDPYTCHVSADMYADNGVVGVN